MFKQEEMKQYVGEYVFLVVEGGRSFPCDVVRVDGDEVAAIETDHDEWPYSVRKVNICEIARVITRDEGDHWTEDWKRAPEQEADWMRRGATEFFTYLRGELNGEDLLARPRIGKRGAA